MFSIKKAAAGVAISMAIGSIMADAAPYAYISGHTAPQDPWSLSVIDLASSTIVANLPIDIGAAQISLNPAGTRMYIGYKGQTTTPDHTLYNQLDVVDATNGQMITTVSLPNPTTSRPGTTAVSPDGKKVYIGMGNGVITVDATNNSILDSITYSGPNDNSDSSMAVNPTGTKMYASGWNMLSSYPAPGVYVTDLVAKTTTPILPQCGGDEVILTPDGSRLYTGNGCVIDTATNSLITQIAALNYDPSVTTGRDAAAMSADGKHAYFLDPAGKVYVVDTTNNTLAATIPVTITGGTGRAWGLSLDTAGDRLYVTGGDSLNIIDTSANTVTAHPQLWAGGESITSGTFVGPNNISFALPPSNPPAPAPASGSSGGGGSFDLMSLFGLSGLIAALKIGQKRKRVCG